MAYSPIGQGRLPASPDLSAIAARHNATTFQVALAWALCDPTVIAIPKAGTEAHVNDIRRALDLVHTADDLAAINASFPAPTRKRRAAVIHVRSPDCAASTIS